MSVKNIKIGKTYILKSPKGIISKFMVVDILQADDLIKVDKKDYYIRLSQFISCIL